jgi:hypothetical protein
VYFKCTGALKRLILKGYTGLKKHACVDSILCCRMKNTLYACIYASRTDSLNTDSVHR